MIGITRYSAIEKYLDSELEKKIPETSLEFVIKSTVDNESTNKINNRPSSRGYYRPDAII